MQIKQISLKNSTVIPYSQQNADLCRVAPSFAGAAKEPQVSKENKVLKLILIGAGALSTIILALNYKKIGALFVKTIKTPPNPTKSPLLPVGDVLKSAGVESEFIEKSKDKGYQLWHFTSRAFLKEFIKSHEDIFKLVNANKERTFIFNNLESIKRFSKDENAIKFISAVKEKTGVDLLGEIKHYRFIGKSELKAIKSKQPVENHHYYSYVTLCPDYGLSCHTFDYRITFKNTKNVMENLHYYHDTQYKNGITEPYSYLDVEKVEKIANRKWQEVKF